MTSDEPPTIYAQRRPDDDPTPLHRASWRWALAAVVLAAAAVLALAAAIPPNPATACNRVSEAADRIYDLRNDPPRLFPGWRLRRAEAAYDEVWQACTDWLNRGDPNPPAHGSVDG